MPGNLQHRRRFCEMAVSDDAGPQPVGEMTPRGSSLLRDPVALIAACAAGALLLYKFWLASILNVNWDEFFYLSNLHEHLRGGTTSVLQRGYVYLFAWLPAFSADEIAQINAARIVMVAFLAVTCGLIWAVGRALGLSGRNAAMAVLAYLVAVPVIRHGGSFRADSMLTPLAMLGMLFLARRGDTIRAAAGAGVTLGIAAFVSVKIVLFAPAFGALAALHPGARPDETRSSWFRARAVAWVAIAAALTLGVLLGLHVIRIAGAEVKSASTVASSAAEKTILTTDWAPRGDMLVAYVDWQPLLWLLIVIGTIISVWRKDYRLTALALCLTPVAYYRNAFPYFYVLMLAPLSILAGYAMEQVESAVKRHSSERIATLLSVIVALGLCYQCIRFAANVRHLHQFQQRAVVTAVHRIFPSPVSYVDRCGMIPEFQRMGPFFSTWGLESYATAGVPFMPGALARRAAFVLANHPALEANSRRPGSLLPTDYELLEKFYVPYWGPIRVAGVRTVLEGDRESLIQVPFPAHYRLVSNGYGIDLGGERYEDGDIVKIFGDTISARISSSSTSLRVSTTLYLASALPPPDEAYDRIPIFAGL